MKYVYFRKYRLLFQSGFVVYGKINTLVSNTGEINVMNTVYLYSFPTVKAEDQLLYTKLQQSLGYGRFPFKIKFFYVLLLYFCWNET